MSQYLISVVIPTFNRSNLLIDALNCLTTQTFKNFEVIVCDDGSTDNTKLICENYKNILNLKYFYNDNWGGPAFPRNIGIKNSDAEWICFLDSDDIWYNNKLEEIYKVISTNNYHVIYHKFCCYNGSKKKVIGNKFNFLLSSMYEQLLYEGNHIVNSSLCVKKKYLMRIGFITENKSVVGVEDYDMLLKLSAINCKFYYINKILGEYRINGDNISALFLPQFEKIKSILLSHYKGKKDNKILGLLDYFEANYLLENQIESLALKIFWNVILKKSSLLLKIKSIFKIISIKIN
jgi:glycosyltransferase involved in cell wall biosynthesis